MVGVSVEIDAGADPSECRHCGRYVTDQFRRVYGDNDDVVHRCGECDSYRRLTRGSAAGVPVSIPDPEVVGGHHGGDSTVPADCRGQMTTGGWIVLGTVLAVLSAVPLLVVMVA